MFEVCLAPRGHRHDFAACNDRELRHLARHVGRTSRRLDDVLASPSFNLILHTGPVTQVDESAGPGSKIAVAYHWHIEILPRLTTMAGFEWATGVFINSVVPEDAAASLRSS